jgi:hypothetical protein
MKQRKRASDIDSIVTSVTSSQATRAGRRRPRVNVPTFQEKARSRPPN